MIDYECQLIKRRSQYMELRNKKLVRQLTIDPSEDVRLCELFIKVWSWKHRDCDQSWHARD